MKGLTVIRITCPVQAPPRADREYTNKHAKNIPSFIPSTALSHASAFVPVFQALCFNDLQQKWPPGLTQG